MKKLLILFILISINAFGWEVKDSGSYKLCNELAEYYIDSSFTSNPITYFDYDSYTNISQNNTFAFRNESLTIVKNIIKNTASYWNEAGSEHLLVGDSSAGDFDIVLRNLHSSYDFDMKFDGYRGDNCAHSGTLTVNASRFQNTGNNKRFFTKLTHEFGHMLGLAHTNEYDCVTSNKQSQACTNTDSYKNAVYMSLNINSNISHLTDDDKYGVRDLYGKDDRQIKYLIEEYLPQGGYIHSPWYGWIEQFYGSGTTYNTFAQPQLISVPNTTNELMLTWIKSSTRKLNVEFTNLVPFNDATNTPPKMQKYLGPYEISGDYEILSSPSIAVNNNGEALIVFQRVKENQIVDLQESLYFVKVNLNNHTFTTPVKITNSELVKSNSVPLILWSQKIQRWIVFWTERNIDEQYNWRINYLISNNSSPTNSTDWNSSNIKTVTYQSNYISAYWNPMSGTCDIKNTQNNEVCALYFNKIKPNSLDSSLSTITFDLTSNNYNINILTHDNLTYNNSYIYNYGHISTTFDENNKIILTFMSQSYHHPIRKCVLNYSNPNFITNPFISECINVDSVDTDTSVPDAHSITGHSVVRKQNASIKANIYTFIAE